ncbi:MAG: hypothetical protein J6I49_07085 [Bacteroidales bacterium]|nr:hypothetical protein [Bacteroidales bacterium]
MNADSCISLNLGFGIGIPPKTKQLNMAEALVWHDKPLELARFECVTTPKQQTGAAIATPVFLRSHHYSAQTACRLRSP